MYDIDPVRVLALVGEGAESAPYIESFSACDAVLTSLPDDDAVSAAVLGGSGLASVLKAGAIHISASTIGVAFCRELEAAHERLGQVLIAMPVLGNPDLAAQKSLFLLLGGQSEAIARVNHLIGLLGQKSFHIGERPWMASAMKLAANMLTAATLQSMGEAFAFLSKAGLNAKEAQEVFTNSLFDGRVHKAYGGKIVNRHYSPPGMTVPLAVKDLRLLLAEAERNKVPIPVASLLRDRLVAVEAQGWSGLDWSALGKLAAFEAGIPDA